MNTLPRDDAYEDVIRLYADHLTNAIEAALLLHLINRYECAELLHTTVKDAQRMAEDFIGWCVADCRWEFGTGPCFGERTWRELDALVQGDVDCLQSHCWYAALWGDSPEAHAFDVAERYFT